MKYQALTDRDSRMDTHPTPADTLLLEEAAAHILMHGAFSPLLYGGGGDDSREIQKG